MHSWHTLSRRSPSCMKRKRGLVVVRSTVHPKRPPPCDGEWADTVEKLKLTTADSQFYEWKPDLPIHFVQKGESGPSVLLIHGFGVGSYTFNRNMPELSESHRVFACDLLGQAASWPCSQPEKEDALEYSIDTWAEQLASFIRDVIADDKGVYLAGNSLGGLLATTVAYRYPELTRGVILLNATPFWTVPNARALAPLQLGRVPLNKSLTTAIEDNLFSIMKNPSWIQEQLKLVYKDHSMIDPECVELMCAACDHPHAAEAFLSIFLSPRGRVGVGVMVKELCEQGIPVCQMHGNEDPWVKAWWARRLKRQVPSVEYYRVSPAGHVVHDEVPETINKLLADWIAGKERDATCRPLVATGDTLEFTESGQYSTAGVKKAVSVTLADGKALNCFEGLTF